MTLMNYTADCAGRPMITVARASKWYGLYLVGRARTNVFPDEPEDIGFHEIEDALVDTWDYAAHGSVYHDHVINPRAVVLYARKLGYDVGDLALEMIVGRWVLEAPIPALEEIAKTLNPVEDP